MAASASRYLSAFLLLALFTPSYAGTVVISDTDYANGDWTSRSDGSPIGSGNQVASGAQLPIGGNPGVYRELRHSGARFGFGPASTYIGWHFFEAYPYDPSGGAVVSVGLQEDVLLSEDANQQGRIALRQDGILFRSKSSYAIDAANLWEGRSLEGLVASDFEAFFNGSFLPTASPDFSENGSELTFGIYRSAVMGGRRSFNSRGGVDNWQIILSTEEIPEPATGVLLCVTGLLFAARRKV